VYADDASPSAWQGGGSGRVRQRDGVDADEQWPVQADAYFTEELKRKIIITSDMGLVLICRRK
jgi:hypothetical protein